MKKSKSILFLCLALACACGKTETEATRDVFLTQLQPRDSILIGDQLEYGLRLPDLTEGTRVMLPRVKDELESDVELVQDWSLDTLSVKKQKKGEPSVLDLKASVIVTSFEDGLYELPGLEVVLVGQDGGRDTLNFKSQFLDVKEMPVDTATFVVHDIKGQIKYPLTAKEVLPWVLGAFGVGALVAAVIVFVIMRIGRRKREEERKREPAHIRALRKLDELRGDKLWAPEKQKQFYSSVTDVLREYIDSRYDVSAMEMTTAEIMDELKKADITPELYGQLKELFECADFVKFARHTVGDEVNASAVPLAVRFVTETYQKDLETETEEKK